MGRKTNRNRRNGSKWFGINEIPYDEMWKDNRYWLPRVLTGERLEADFLFDDSQNLLEHEIRKVDVGHHKSKMK